MSDFTGDVLAWLHNTHEVTPETAMILHAGLCVGLALAVRHTKYAWRAHRQFDEDMRIALAASTIEFEAMAVASGDERTSPESMADELVEACPLPT